MIIVNYQGRLGNNLIQYIFGRILANKLDCGLKANSIKGFPNCIEIKNDNDDNNNKHYVLMKHKVNIIDVLNLRNNNFILKGFFQRYEYYKKYKEIIKNDWLYCSVKPKYIINDNDIAVNIRVGDTVKNNDINFYMTKNHCACPYFYFDNILSQRKWNKVWIITENPKEPRVKKLKEKYSANVISNSVIEDYALLKSFKHIIISQSTFSWLAAWLSDAIEIHFPLIGDWHPETPRGDEINLWVDEDRYTYHDLNTNNIYKFNELENLRKKPT